MSFVPEGVRPLGNDTEIGVGNHLRHLIESNAAIEFDALFKTKPFHQLSQFALFITAYSTVDVELRSRYFAFDVNERLDRDVKSLVPLKTTRKQYDEFAVSSCFCVSGEHLGVDVINKHRALAL